MQVKREEEGGLSPQHGVVVCVVCGADLPTHHGVGFVVDIFLGLAQRGFGAATGEPQRAQGLARVRLQKSVDHTT